MRIFVQIVQKIKKITAEIHAYFKALLWELLKKGKQANKLCYRKICPKSQQEFFDFSMLQLIYIFYTTSENQLLWNSIRVDTGFK